MINNNPIKSIIVFWYVILLMTGRVGLFGQPAPAEDENIPYLVTFGGNSDKSWGDDDFCQIFFFKVPRTHTEAVFLRVYDPDTGGEIDRDPENSLHRWR